MLNLFLVLKIHLKFMSLKYAAWRPGLEGNMDLAIVLNFVEL
jgi:hypothetical protein